MGKICEEKGLGIFAYDLSQPVKVMSLDSNDTLEVFFESKDKAAKCLNVCGSLLSTNIDKTTGIFTVYGVEIILRSPQRQERQG
jgi:hypothetical protein